ncbi:MAG: Fe(2+) transporter permease subunit FeoB [Burkholderiales bacterium]|nr:Fe(2+) transporter permease subunit FeoB [Burkholderiales bacterium]
MSAVTLALVGNPNCGKTTLFNQLTGARQRVGNWPGVTVEKKTGAYRHGGRLYTVVDLPGTYSLDVADAVSLDERIARDYVQAGEADLIVNIVDAANLERNLYLTLQLAELGVPLVVALNMVDVAEARGQRIDLLALQHALGCPVVPVVASAGLGIATLKDAIARAADEPPRPQLSIDYPPELAAVVSELAQRLEAAAASARLAPRALAVRLLEGDELARRLAGPQLSAQAAAAVEALGGEIDLMVADARYGRAHRIVQTAVRASGRVSRDLTDRIDRVVLNRVLGIPIFLALMYLMFLFTIHIGGAFIDFFDQAAGALFVEGLGVLLATLGAPEWLRVAVAQGIGGGLQTVATFIPVIGFLYLGLAVLEDSGYMARAAFVMDRFMRWVGLPGKSFVPLIVGFGCNVPAIMATRTLEHRRDRLMTIAMAPFMSCGARLPVYVLFAAAFFPHAAHDVVFTLYLIGIAVAVLTGLALKHTLLKGEASPFIMELPPYHRPTLRGVGLAAWERLKQFVFRAGRVIVPMVLVINFLNAVGTDGSFGHEDSERSVLAAIGRTIAPAFAPLGLSEENWPATVGIFTGILAKEVVVGTLNATYSALAAEATGADEAQEPFDLATSLEAALLTIPQNLVDALGTWADPLGLAAAGDTQSFVEEQGIAQGTFGAMAARFDGAAGAFAYLLFILLYMPCTAATAAVYQEAGARWTAFVVLWSTGLAYALATVYYQAATFARDPFTATLWIAAMCALLVAALGLMRWLGRRPETVPGAALHSPS